MSVRKKGNSTSSTITLYGDRFTELERICFDNKITTTAFYNTVVDMFASGALKIVNSEHTRRRVSGEDIDEVLEQLKFSVIDREGNQIY